MILKAVLLYSLPIVAFGALWWKVSKKPEDNAELDAHKIRHGCTTDEICARANKCVFRCHTR